MLNQFSRNELAIGNEGIKVLHNATVVVVGVGGVGSYAVEALARSGIGTIILIDRDTIDITNINRQLPALLSTIGQSKVEIMCDRIHDINPDCNVIVHQTFITEENISIVFEMYPDFVVEAIDTIKIKGLILSEALKRNIKIISSMGMANKMDPTRIKIIDIWDTTYDPIARILRKMLREEKLSFKKLPVVCSTEIPIKQRQDVVETIVESESEIRKQQLPPSSNSFVPSVAGLFCASYVVNEILKNKGITIQRLHEQ